MPFHPGMASIGPSLERDVQWEKPERVEKPGEGTGQKLTRPAKINPVRQMSMSTCWMTTPKEFPRMAPPIFD